MCPPRMEPPRMETPSPVEGLESNSADLQSQIPWEAPVPLPDPQVGMPDVAFRTFTMWENFFGKLVGRPPGGYGV